MRTKTCETCFQDKPITEFDSKVKGMRLWVDGTCLKCRRIGRRPLKELIAESKVTIKSSKKYKSDEHKRRMSGVYLLIRDGKIVYVGQSSHLLLRLQGHHYGFGCQVLFIKESDSQKRLELENELINKYNPRFNDNLYSQAISTITIEDLNKIYPK